MGSHYQPLRQFPQLSYILHLLEIGPKGNKNAYHKSLEKNDSYLNLLKEKMVTQIKRGNTFRHFDKKHSTMPNSTPHQYTNVITNISWYKEELLTTTNSIRWELSHDNKCLFCNDHIQTIEHIYLK